AAPAGPGLRRQPAKPPGRGRLDVPLEGPGPGPHGDADRGWDGHRWSNLRIRSPAVFLRGDDRSVGHEATDGSFFEAQPVVEELEAGDRFPRANLTERIH